jgi:four helix bundle protein
MNDQRSFYIRSFRFALDILRLNKDLRGRRQLESHLVKQLIRAGTSIGANLEEARSAHSRRDLASKQTIALREARECHFWLRLIAAEEPRFEPSISPLLEECSQLVAMLTASVKTLRQKRDDN